MHGDLSPQVETKKAEVLAERVKAEVVAETKLKAEVETEPAESKIQYKQSNRAGSGRLDGNN